MQIYIAAEKDLPAVFALRVEVFVDEQHVPPDIELDAHDADAVHIIAQENGLTVGCARILIDQNGAHIGRLAVKKAYRGRHIGTDICRVIIAYCKQQGYTPLWLNAQLHAKAFYEKLGFIPQGDIFTEAGIPHIKMVKSAETCQLKAALD